MTLPRIGREKWSSRLRSPESLSNGRSWKAGIPFMDTHERQIGCTLCNDSASALAVASPMFAPYKVVAVYRSKKDLLSSLDTTVRPPLKCQVTVYKKVWRLPSPILPKGEFIPFATCRRARCRLAVLSSHLPKPHCALKPSLPPHSTNVPGSNSRCNPCQRPRARHPCTSGCGSCKPRSEHSLICLTY
jgi:hypothetical protein